MDKESNFDEWGSFSLDEGLAAREGEHQRAILVGVYSGKVNKELCERHLDELKSLADTFGVETVAKFPAPVRKIDASTYLQKGKLDEVRAAVMESHATLLIFDEEISPGQQRNLEKLLRMPVMDRTELILEIFAARAQTKEASLQVELARLRYQYPRLKRLWSHFSRQRASGGFLKGEGEKQLELDRRMIQRRIERLTGQLKKVKRVRETQKRARLRAQIPTCALVGYTNAGKSTLMNALTDAEVLVEDKLFATLDPTTRKLILPNKQKVLLTDTVGFVRKLPHTLVAAFQSTLESALSDEILLHLVDVSDPLAKEHAETTFSLLEELNVDPGSVLTLLNKVDQCLDRSRIIQLKLLYPKNVEISAKTGEGIDRLLDLIIKELASKRTEMHLRIPQAKYQLVSELHRFGEVLYEEYEDNDCLVRAMVPPHLQEKLRAFETQ